MTQFDDCIICGANNWALAYNGPIRSGAFGTEVPQADIGRCSGCGVLRLAEEFCLPVQDYMTDAYRERLEQSTNEEGYRREHDWQQFEVLRRIGSDLLRGNVVADIGCAAGSFLDHISGLAREIVAVEPCQPFHASLESRGFHVFDYAADALEEWKGRIDVAVSFHVIEHVEDPRTFLEDIRMLMSRDGRLFVSTPNLDDILMDLLPEHYRPFFYRQAHRWYFKADSLVRCAEQVGLRPRRTLFTQRYSASNMMAWLRDKRPTGATRLPNIDETLDSAWKSYVESRGKAEHLMLELVRAD